MINEYICYAQVKLLINLKLLASMLKRYGKIFLVMLIFLSTYSLFSQAENRIDSLQNILNSRGMKPNQKLEIQLQIIDYRRLSHQFDEMKLAIDEANKLMVGSNDSCTFNKMLLFESQYAVAIGNKIKANSLSNKALLSSRLNDCHEIEVELLLFQAIFLQANSKPDSSLNKIKQAQRLATEIDNEVLYADALYWEAIFHILTQSPIEGRRILEQLLSTYIAYKENAKIGSVYADIGYTYFSQSKYDTALIYYETAIPFLEKGKGYGYLAMVYNNVGLIHQNTGKISKAITTYFEGLKISDRINSGSNRRLILYNLGNCYYDLDAKENAYESYKHSLEQAEIAKDTFLIIYSSNAIGNMAIDKNESDSAQKYATKSYKMAKLMNDRYANIFCSASMAKLEILKNNLNLAKQYISEAKSYAKGRSNPEGAFIINEVEARFLAKQKQYTKAINLLKDTYQEAIRINSYQSARYVLETMSEIYEEAHDFENALIYSKKIKKYQDSINAVATLADLVRNINIYEQEKAERIKQLEFEKTELKKSSELRYTRLIAFIAIIFTIALIIMSWLFFKLSQTRKKKNQNLKEKNKLIETHRDDLEKLVNKLQRITNELDVSNKTKSKLLSIIGHDLKNPFNVILGYADILNTEYENFGEEKRRKMIDEIDKSSRLTYNLLDNLLNWSRAQEGNIKINKEVFFLNQLVTEISEPHLLSAKSKHIEIFNKVYTETEIEVDKLTISSAIGNILSNAIKFTPVGGSITISDKINNHFIELSFKDTGIGMSEDFMKNIFKLCDNQSTKGTNNEVGTGLGLLLCREFIKKNGGEISVESEEGKGSTFIVKLPRFKKNTA